MDYNLRRDLIDDCLGCYNPQERILSSREQETILKAPTQERDDLYLDAIYNEPLNEI